MARAFGEVTVQDIHGNFLPGVSVDLIDPATGARILDTVFADELTTATLSLPLTTDVNGRVRFYLATGKLLTARTTIRGTTYDDLVAVVDPTATGSGIGGAVPPHTHVESDVTALPTDLTGKANVGHVHAETDVANLVVDLSNKAPVAHAHAEADVSSLTTDLAATEKTANKGVANGYAGLDNTNLIPIARIATGAAAANTFLTGNRTLVTLPVNVYAFPLKNPAVGTYTLLQLPASRAGTVVEIRAFVAGGTSVAFNWRKNGTTLLHTGDITATAGWSTITTALVNTALAANDYLEVLVNTVTGTVTDFTAQLGVQS